MSNIFCSQCGAKHPAGSRFCSACGNALSSFTPPRQQNQHVEIHHDEPSSFRKPKNLSYETRSIWPVYFRHFFDSECSFRTKP